MNAACVCWLVSCMYLWRVASTCYGPLLAIPAFWACAVLAVTLRILNWLRLGYCNPPKLLFGRVLYAK
jgi:hypothetical protein